MNDKNAVQENVVEESVKKEAFCECFICRNPIATRNEAVRTRHYENFICNMCFLKISTPIINTKGSKIGRNELCSCGSGKKYKKCCLKDKI